MEEPLPPRNRVTRVQLPDWRVERRFKLALPANCVPMTVQHGHVPPTLYVMAEEGAQVRGHAYAYAVDDYFPAETLPENASYVGTFWDGATVHLFELMGNGDTLPSVLKDETPIVNP